MDPWWKGYKFIAPFSVLCQNCEQCEPPVGAWIELNWIESRFAMSEHQIWLDPDDSEGMVFSFTQDGVSITPSSMSLVRTDGPAANDLSSSQDERPFTKPNNEDN